MMGLLLLLLRKGLLATRTLVASSISVWSDGLRNVTYQAYAEKNPTVPKWLHGQVISSR